jgi:hypothetical protein
MEKLSNYEPNMNTHYYEYLESDINVDDEVKIINELENGGAEIGDIGVVDNIRALKGSHNITSNAITLRINNKKILVMEKDVEKVKSKI